MGFLGFGKKKETAPRQHVRRTGSAKSAQQQETKERGAVPFNGCEVRVNVDWANSGVPLGACGVVQSIETNGFYVNYVLNGRILFHPMWHWMSFVFPVADETDQE